VSNIKIHKYHSPEEAKKIRDDFSLRLNESGFLDAAYVNRITLSDDIKVDNSFNIKYHTIRLNDELGLFGDGWGAQFHLAKVIEYMTIKIMEDHCE